MATEIERRFLVAGSGWRASATSPRRIAQGYLAASKDSSVRIRIKDGKAAWLTIKSGKAGVSRAEFEYAIPVEDAQEMMALRIGIVIEKQRHLVTVGGSQWEVDVFSGALSGLVIAEIELDRPDQPFERPDWIGKEVTDDGRYTNAALATHGLPDPE